MALMRVAFSLSILLKLSSSSFVSPKKSKMNSEVCELPASVAETQEGDPADSQPCDSSSNQHQNPVSSPVTPPFSSESDTFTPRTAGSASEKSHLEFSSSAESEDLAFNQRLFEARCQELQLEMARQREVLQDEFDVKLKVAKEEFDTLFEMQRKKYDEQLQSTKEEMESQSALQQYEHQEHLLAIQKATKRQVEIKKTEFDQRCQQLEESMERQKQLLQIDFDQRLEEVQRESAQFAEMQKKEFEQLRQFHKDELEVQSEMQLQEQEERLRALREEMQKQAEIKQLDFDERCKTLEAEMARQKEALQNEFKQVLDEVKAEFVVLAELHRLECEEMLHVKTLELENRCLEFEEKEKAMKTELKRLAKKVKQERQKLQDTIKAMERGRLLAKNKSILLSLEKELKKEQHIAHYWEQRRDELEGFIACQQESTKGQTKIKKSVVNSIRRNREEVVRVEKVVHDSLERIFQLQSKINRCHSTLAQLSHSERATEGDDGSDESTTTEHSQSSQSGFH